jgi:hypothetical protein
MQPNNYYKVSVKTSHDLAVHGRAFVRGPESRAGTRRTRVCSWTFPFHSALVSSAYEARRNALDVIASLAGLPLESEPVLSVYEPIPMRGRPPALETCVIGRFPEPTLETIDPEFLH